MRAVLTMFLFCLAVPAFADSYVLKCHVVFKTIPWGGDYTETTSSPWFVPVYPGARTVMEMGFEPYVVRTTFIVSREVNDSEVSGIVRMWPLGESKYATESGITFESPSAMPSTFRFHTTTARQSSGMENSRLFDDSATVVCRKD